MHTMPRKSKKRCKVLKETARLTLLKQICLDECVINLSYLLLFFPAFADGTPDTR